MPRQAMSNPIETIRGYVVPKAKKNYSYCTNKACTNDTMTMSVGGLVQVDGAEPGAVQF